MKHLGDVQKIAEEAAKKYGLNIDQVAGFSDGTYRVEFSERKEERRIGFIAEPTGKAGSNTGKAHTPRGRK